MPRAPWPRWQAVALPVAVLLLAWELLPVLDLMTSHWAYHAGRDGFWLRDSAPAQLVYRGTRYVTTVAILGLVGLVAWGYADREPLRRSRGRGAALALLAIAIGPGLIVHPLLKDHWGRPRPVQIAEFGGLGQYVPPGLVSDQCARNCSFVSGHAASGYLFVCGALVWPRQRRRWLLGGLVLGTAVGAVRIIQGAHFLSDVLGSGIVVVGTFLVIEAWARRRGWLPATSG